MAVSVVFGILVGTFYANHFSGNRLSIINNGSNRLNNLLRIIDDQYVDSVNIDDLVDKAIPQILAQLDPHSTYISAEDVQKVNSELKGSFSGVGIEFTIQRDTINVGNVIKGGPAEKMGLLAGDKIVEVDGKPFVGQVVTDTEARRRLMGPKGTKVEVGVVRYGTKAVKRFTITRADIVTPSIAATYMLNDSTGYIRIKSFGQKTYMEMLASLASLSQQGFSSLIIDLRDNNGGYLESAIQMADEFLPKDRLIVYTQGRKSPRRDYRSSGRGAYQTIPLVVLINEASASSAEIFAGAIQDNDRGRSDSPTAARSASPSPATTRPRAAAYRSPTSSATRPTTTRTSSSATSGASSSPATASTIRVPPTTPRSDAPSMAVAASRPTSSWPRTRPTSPPTTSRPS